MIKIRATKNQKGFAHLWLILVILVVIAGVGFAAMRVINKHNQGKNGGTNGSFTAGCSGNNKVSMTHMPMNIDDISTIAPIGLTAGAHVTPIDHLYFYPKEGPRDKYPVYAMADGTITEIQVREVNVSNGEKRPPEYRIVMQHSCRTSSYFDLVTKLDQSILDKAPDLATTKHFSGRITIKAGQEIGRIGAQSLDTAIYDANLTLPGFIHTDMYKAEPWKIHTDDFFSYFSGSILSQMLAKDARKVKPYGGKIDYDQAGKLIGNWFKQGTNGYAGPSGGTGVGDSSGRGYWSGHLAIFYDAIDPSRIVVSIGDFGNGQPMAFHVIGNKPDPATIDQNSGVIKYELYTAPPGINPTGGTMSEPTNPQIAGTILLQVMAGEKLKVEIFPGKTGSQVTGFTSATTYER